MPTFYTSIPDNLRDFALAQPLFFTASAPSHGAHVNISPKGYPRRSLAVLGPNQCAYVDFTGSGCETISHVYENGRVTLMWCSFGKSPRIMRWFCRGRVVENTDTKSEGEFWSLLQKMRANGLEMKEVDGAGKAKGWRSIILFDVWKVQTSCGFGVPLMVDLSPQARAKEDDEQVGTPQSRGVGSDKAPAPNEKANEDDEEAGAPQSTEIGSNKVPAYKDRPTMDWYMNRLATKGRTDNLDDTPGAFALEYQSFWNTQSLDGLPGLRYARRARARNGGLKEIGKMGWVETKRRARDGWDARGWFLFGLLWGVACCYIWIFYLAQFVERVRQQYEL